MVIFFMIEKIVIEKINNEDVMFVYLDFNYEFSNFNRKNIKRRLDIEIKKKQFKGKKVLFVVSGIIIGSILLNKPNVTYDFDYIKDIGLNKPIIIENKEVINDDIINESKDDNNSNIVYEVIDSNKNNNEDSNQSNNINDNQNNINDNQNNFNSNDEDVEIKEDIIEEIESKEDMVTVYRTNGEIININMTDYLVGVVSAEMPASFPIEALKAQAVVARTYALRAINNGKKLTDSTSTQVYKDNNQLKSLWGADYEKYYSKIYEAVTSTNNLAIYYNGNYIDAVYHSTSNGYTENAENVWGNSVPYLQTVSSSWDENASSYLKTITKEEADIINLLGIENFDEIQIIERNISGRVEKVKVGDKIYSGVEFRNLLGLRSTDFEIIKDNGTITITTKGYGHGVGMSQYGAKGMADAGYDYKSILNHYYTNVEIY